MSAPIKTGDLVMVVRTCCTQRVRPTLFRVGEILPPLPSKQVCSCCDTRLPSEPFGHSGVAQDIGQPLSWLRRIDPLHDPEEHRQTEELPHEPEHA